MWFWPGLNRDNAAVSPEPRNGIDVHYYLSALFPSFPPSLATSLFWLSVHSVHQFVGVALTGAWRLAAAWFLGDCFPPMVSTVRIHPPTHHLDTIGRRYSYEAKRSYYCNDLTFSNLDLPEFCSPGVFYKLVITDRKTGFWSPVWLVVF